MLKGLLYVGKSPGRTFTVGGGREKENAHSLKLLVNGNAEKRITF